MHTLLKLGLLCLLNISSVVYACSPSLAEFIYGQNYDFPYVIPDENYKSEEVIVSVGVNKCLPQINMLDRRVNIDSSETLSSRLKRTTRIYARIYTRYCDMDIPVNKYVRDNFGGNYVRVYDENGNILARKLINKETCE